VLSVTLGRVTLGAYVQTKGVNFGVRKVGKFGWDRVVLHKPGVRHAEVIDHVVSDCPRICEDDLAAIGSKSPRELCLWRFRVDPGLALAVIEEATAEGVTGESKGAG